MSKRAIIRYSVAVLLCALSFSVSAQISAEYYFDTDPGFGRGTPLSVSAQGTVSSAINVSALSDGMHVLAVRAKNSAGKWSAASHSLLYKMSDTNLELAAAEYYFDSNPGFGKGTSLAFAKQNGYYTITSDIDVSALSDGMHVLAVRAKNSAGKWSAASHSLIYKMSETNLELAAAEYYFDSDPGFGKGTSLTFAKQNGYYTITSNIDVSALSDGMHVLAVRAKSSAGKWSAVSHSLIHKYSTATLNDSVETVYYYWDEDVASKTELPVTRLGNDVEIIADLNGLSQFENEVPHYLFIEAHTSRGYVSLSCFEVMRDMYVGTEQLTVKELKIYPVPFSTQLFVETMGDGDKIVLTDMTGRKLFTTTKAELNGAGLDVSHLSAGTYLLTVYQGEKVITKVVIKQ